MCQILPSSLRPRPPFGGENERCCLLQLLTASHHTADPSSLRSHLPFKMRTRASRHTPTRALHCFPCNYFVILTVEIAVKRMVVERVFLQAGSLKDTHAHYISITHICSSQQTGGCSKSYRAGVCFPREGQVVSRKAEVNLRLSGPEADWSQTGMWLTDFLRDPLGPSGMLLSFGTSFITFV